MTGKINHQQAEPRGIDLEDLPQIAAELIGRLVKCRKPAATWLGNGRHIGIGFQQGYLHRLGGPEFVLHPPLIGLQTVDHAAALEMEADARYQFMGVDRLRDDVGRAGIEGRRPLICVLQSRLDQDRNIQ